MLADRGATIIDADELAREAVRPETQALRDIVKRWGKDVIKQDGSLDRGALRRIVFADQTELDALNRIVHPGVTRMQDREVARAKERGDPIVVCVIPLLFERASSTNLTRSSWWMLPGPSARASGDHSRPRRDRGDEHDRRTNARRAEARAGGLLHRQQRLT